MVCSYRKGNSALSNFGRHLGYYLEGAWGKIFWNEADPNDGLLLLAKREFQVLDGAKSATGGIIIYNWRKNEYRLLQIFDGLPSNDVTALAMDGKITWIGGRGFVAIADMQERKVLRIAYVSASRIYGIKLGPVHAWVGVSCGKDGAPDYCGNARTGIYRFERAAIETPVYTSMRR